MTLFARRFSPVLAAACLAVIVAAPIRAQGIASDDSAAASVRTDTVATPVAAGPTLAAARVAARAPAPATGFAAPAAGHKTDQSTALMIVGSAAILTGIVIGNGAGYAISIGGAVIGLIGLYQYLQ